MEFERDGSGILSGEEHDAYLPVEVKLGWPADEIASLRLETVNAISRNMDRDISSFPDGAGRKKIEADVRRNLMRLRGVISKIDTYAKPDIGDQFAAYLQNQ